MAKGFTKIRFNVARKSEKSLRNVGTRGFGMRGIGRTPAEDERSVSFNSDEAAARFYLGKVLEKDRRRGVRGLAASARARAVPEMEVVDKQDMPLTKTKILRFNQTHKTIPIFGSRVNVELDENRELVGIGGDVAQSLKGVSAIPSLSPMDGLGKIAELTKKKVEELGEVDPPDLTFFHDEEKGSWHLAYFFKNIAAAPAEFMKSASRSKSHGHGFGSSPRQRFPKLHYLVDAHDGSVVFYYSASPMIDIPVKCRGVDVEGVQTEFWGSPAQPGFQMSDPVRMIKTFDLALGGIESAPVPLDPIRSNSANFPAKTSGAVSAHANATKVYMFYKSVLMRDGVDDKGMDLVSVVNCTDPASETPPEWHNAVWWNNRMWYGQNKDANGKLVSYSRFLDVIAHELTHGVTESTAALVYQGESGALDESVADIFGIIVKNWYGVGADSNVDQWDWELGTGLGQNGKPLRDLSNPKRTGDPDHMRNFLRTSFDNGGVHTNSNIHNKAAYNVLTAKDGAGDPAFSPREVAVLYYLALVRLGRRATFTDMLAEMAHVADVYFSGDESARKSKVKAVKEAYKGVGIE